MKKRNVIKSSNLRLRSPVMSGLIIYMALDKWNAPEWLWGVLGLLVLMWIITFIIDMFNTTEIDLFADDKDMTGNKKKTFKERIDEKTK